MWESESRVLALLAFRSQYDLKVWRTALYGDPDNGEPDIKNLGRGDLKGRFQFTKEAMLAFVEEKEDIERIEAAFQIIEGRASTQLEPVPDSDPTVVARPKRPVDKLAEDGEGFKTSKQPKPSSRVLDLEGLDGNAAASSLVERAHKQATKDT